MTHILKKYWLYGVLFLLTLIVFHLCLGLAIVNPTNINWLLSARHDWGQHYLGWAFYRNEPWTFPLGEISALCYPSGTNVGFWDSIPLLALLFKPFSALLPHDFQYIGIWLLFCYFMAGFYSVKIFNIYNVKPLYALLGALLIVCCPVLTYRLMHPALCAHWLIIASVYFYLKPATQSNVARLNKNQIILIALTALLNPYLTVTIIGFNIILPFKHYFYNKLLLGRQAVTYIAISFFSIPILWYLLGMLSFGHGERLSVDKGYGMYALNLNSLFNASGFSKMLPKLPLLTIQQYEGFMYLGVGLMVLIVLALVYGLVTKNFKNNFKHKKYLWPLFWLAMALAVFAITNRITYNDSLLLEIPVPKFVLKFGGIFRASGRFFWVAYYLIILFSIVVFAKIKLPDWLKSTVLILIVCLQAYDVHPLFFNRNFVSGTYNPPLTVAKWNTILPYFDRMITYPPYNNNLLKSMDYQDLCFVALKNHNAISTGYTARENGYAYKIYIRALNASLKNGTLQPNELYITTPAFLDAFDVVIKSKKATVTYLDGYYLIYSNKKNIKLTPHDVRDKQKLDSIYKLYTKPSIIKTITTPVFTNNKIQFNIEQIDVDSTRVSVNGWGYLKESDNNKGDSVFVALAYGGKTYIANTKQVLRPDVTGAQKKQYLDNSGFSAAIFPDAVFPEDALLVLAIKNTAGNWAYASAGSLNKLSVVKTAHKVTGNLPVTANQMGSIDQVLDDLDYITVMGWTAFKDTDAANTEIKVVFAGNGDSYIVSTLNVPRPDVTAANGNKFNYDNSGFTIKIRKTDLPASNYKIGLFVSNKKTKKQSVLMTRNKVIIE